MPALFTETANNEKEHAKMWFKLLHDGGYRQNRRRTSRMRLPVKTMSGPICMRPLQRKHREEGFDHIAKLFEMVGEIEKEHEARYLALCKNIKKRARYLTVKANKLGSAATADTSTLERKHRRFVRSAHIQRHTLS